MEPLTKSVNREKNKKAFLAEPGVQQKITAIANNLGISEDELLYAMAVETGGSYSSAQRNLGNGRAVGLIQFYPDNKNVDYKTIQGTRYETSDLEKMSSSEQLDIVEKYLIQNFKNKGGKPGELYISIAYPDLIGKSDETEIDPSRLDSVSAQNPSWVKDGKITKGSISSSGSKPEFATIKPEVVQEEATVDTREQASKKYSGNSSRIKEAQKFLKDYRKIENSQYNEIGKQQAIAKLYTTSPGAKYAIPNYVQGVARTSIGDTGMSGIDMDKLQEGYVDKDAGYLTARGDSPSLTNISAFVRKIRKDLSEQGQEQILNRAYKVDQIFDGVAPSKLFERIPEYANPEGTNYTLNPNKLDVSILKNMEPLMTNEDFLEKTPETSKLGTQNKKEDKFFIGPDGKEYAFSKDKPVNVTPNTARQTSEIYTDNEMQTDTTIPSDNEINLSSINNTYTAPPKKPLGQKLKNNIDEAFFALSAGAGIMSIYEATRKDKVTKSHIDPLFKEALMKTREASQTGLPYEQRQAAIKDIANSYSGAMKNVMAISGGQRGTALANIGAVDSSRVNALVDLASKSADLRQKNLDLYSKTAAAYSQQQLSADMNHEKLKQTVESNRQSRLSQIGLNLFKEATEFSRNYMILNDINSRDTEEQIEQGQDNSVVNELGDNI